MLAYFNPVALSFKRRRVFQQLQNELSIGHYADMAFHFHVRFVGPYTQDDYPITLRLRQKIFFEASVDTIDHRLTILARECFATPSPDINSSPKYWIIKNG